MITAEAVVAGWVLVAAAVIVVVLLVRRGRGGRRSFRGPGDARVTLE